MASAPLPPPFPPRFFAAYLRRKLQNSFWLPILLSFSVTLAALGLLAGLAIWVRLWWAA